jgi:uroporphyrinogen-III decarboxylase
MEKKWGEMTTDEKYQSLVQRWLSPANVKYVSPKAEKEYKARVQRFLDAINLKEPDRVPCFPMMGFFGAYYGGITPRQAMYDYEKLFNSYRKMILDFQPDAHGGVATAPPGRCYDILDYKLYAWPGHGVPEDASYQALEGEYMKADEYDSLINDPTNYFISTYFPRVFGALDSFKSITPLTNIMEMYGGFTAAALSSWGQPAVQEALKKLMEAGAEASKWMQVLIKYGSEMTANGFPGFFGGGTKAPFDMIGDTMRGTKGMIIDMYRQPKKVLRACEQVTPLLVKMGVTAARNNGNPVVFIPLHKGADGFMNDAQFKNYYWPSLKALIEGLVVEGCVPFPWAEGGYNTRLNYLGDVPQGRVVWGFDTTDMAKAKKALQGKTCVSGNMPIAQLAVGNPKEIKETIKKLVADCAPGGGYIMMSGAVIENLPPANIHAMIDATKEFGVYKK